MWLPLVPMCNQVRQPGWRPGSLCFAEKCLFLLLLFFFSCTLYSMNEGSESVETCQCGGGWCRSRRDTVAARASDRDSVVIGDSSPPANVCAQPAALQGFCPLAAQSLPETCLKPWMSLRRLTWFSSKNGPKPRLELFCETVRRPNTTVRFQALVRRRRQEPSLQPRLSPTITLEFSPTMSRGVQTGVRGRSLACFRPRTVHGPRASGVHLHSLQYLRMTTKAPATPAIQCEDRSLSRRRLALCNLSTLQASQYQRTPLGARNAIVQATLRHRTRP
jgi:hypothetical protein